MSGTKGRLRRRLKFDTVPFLGRTEELQKLHQSKARVTLIYGYSGVGKTSLVERAFREEPNNLYCYGKFDQLMSSSEPYAAVSGALSTIVSQLRNDHAEENDQLSALFESMENKNRIVLARIVSSLEAVLFPGGRSQDDGEAETETQYRAELAKLAIADFIERVQTKNEHRTVVMVLEDVHWADEASLDLISYLSSSDKSSGAEADNFRLVLTFRNNEVGDGVASVLRQLRHSPDPPLDLELGNLKIEQLHKMVCALMESKNKNIGDDRGLDELVKVVHRKTEGNVFFSLQLMGWFYRKDLIWYDAPTYRWKWNLDEMEASATLSDNAVCDVVEEGLAGHLTGPSTRAVMLASCIGSHFEPSLILGFLRAADGGGEAAEEVDFGELVRERLLLKQQRGKHTTYRFAHDRIQETAYEMFESREERERTHLALGRHLCSSVQDTGTLGSVNHRIFLLGTEQMNLGRVHITDQAERLQLAQYNDRSAHIAISISAFCAAAKFHRTALGLLDEDDVASRNDELVLSILSTFAESLYTLGEYAEMDRILNRAFERARCLADRRLASYIKIRSMMSRNQLKEAVPYGQGELRKYGIALPRRKVRKLHILQAYFVVGRLLRRTTLEEILEREEMADERQLYCTKMLCTLGDICFCMNDADRMILLYLHAFRLSLQHGPNKYTPQALVYFGVLVSTASGDFQAARRIADFVTKLATRFRSLYHQAQTFVPYHAFLRFLQSPSTESLDALLGCFRTAMRTGDLFGACNAVSLYAQIYFLCGRPLHPFVKDATAFRDHFVGKSEQAHIRFFLDLIGQMALNLTGLDNEGNPFEIQGRSFERASLLEAKEEKNEMTLVAFWMGSMYLAYILDPSSPQLQHASQQLFEGRLKTNIVEGTVNYGTPIFAFFAGMATTALERRLGPARRFRSRRTRYLKILERYVANGVPGISQKVAILKAEMQTLQSSKVDTDTIRKDFDLAIRSAFRAGYLLDAVLAYERCGEHFLLVQGQDVGKLYLIRALQLYRKWGATVKVRSMMETYTFLAETDITELGQHDLHSSTIAVSDHLESLELHKTEVSALVFDR